MQEPARLIAIVVNNQLGGSAINDKKPGRSEATPLQEADKHVQGNKLTKECQMLRTAKQILERRRLRQAEFGPKLFAEPGWDMLLELYISESAGASTTAAQLNAKSRAPDTTFVRWLQNLEQEVLVTRRPHPVDHGTEFVELTNKARGALERYLTAVVSL